MRDELDEREYDERPANVRHYGRGYVPAYEWRYRDESAIGEASSIEYMVSVP